MSITFEEVYEETGQRLRNFLLSGYVNESEVDDLLQEIFMKVHRGLEGLKDETKVVSWVFRIARTTVIDHYRRSSKTASIALPDGIKAKEVNYRFGMEPTILKRALRAIIQKLPSIYSEALTLSELEGLPQKELAARLNLSVPGAKSRVQRGRKLLKAKVQEFCRFELDSFGSVIDIEPISCPINKEECSKNIEKNCILLKAVTSLKKG